MNQSLQLKENWKWAGTLRQGWLWSCSLTFPSIRNNSDFSNFSWFCASHLYLADLDATDLLNSSVPGQNGRLLPDDIFKCIFFNKKFSILIQISLKFVSEGPIANKSALVHANGFASNRRQAITCTNADPIHWCIYAITKGQWVNKLVLVNSICKHLKKQPTKKL